LTGKVSRVSRGHQQPSQPGEEKKFSYVHKLLF
jgi:hypothetical protein